MDMAVANLLKRKIDFRFSHEENRYSNKKLRYVSMLIENKLNIDVDHIYELCLDRIVLLSFISFRSSLPKKANVSILFPFPWNCGIYGRGRISILLLDIERFL